MCGFVGGIHLNESQIRQGLLSMQHRGRDSSDIYLDEYVALGFNRLAIIDLDERANQPMPNENKSIWLVISGEIWNYKELRKVLNSRHQFRSKGDSEVVVHAYEYLLKQGVKNRLISDVPLCALLSGGIDSLILTYCAKQLRPDIEAYVLSFGESDGKDDLFFARKTAEWLKVPFLHRPLVEYCLNIPEICIAHKEYRKFLLIKAFGNEIPYDMLMRPKTTIQDGTKISKMLMDEIPKSKYVKNGFKNEKEVYQYIFNQIFRRTQTHA